MIWTFLIEILRTFGIAVPRFIENRIRKDERDKAVIEAKNEKRVIAHNQDKVEEEQLLELMLQAKQEGIPLSRKARKLIKELNSEMRRGKARRQDQREERKN